MALGDAMFGLGIGLQGQAKLDTTAPMQAFKQRQAAKAAQQKAVDAQVANAMKDFLKFEGYHNKYLPIAQEEVSNTWQKMSDIIDKGEPNMKNQIGSILIDAKAVLDGYKNSSDVLFRYEKNKQNFLAPPGFDEALGNAGDFSDLEGMRDMLDLYGVQYDPQRKQISGTFGEVVDLNKTYKSSIDEAYADEIIETQTQIGADGNEAIITYSRPNAGVRKSALESLLKTNKGFAQTFMKAYGLNTVDVNDANVQQAMKTFDEGAKNLHTVARSLGAGSKGATFIAQTTTGQVVPDIQQQVQPFAGGFIDGFGRMVQAGRLATRSDIFPTVSLPRTTASGENASIIFNTSSIVPLESGAKGQAGVKDTGSVYNVNRKGSDVTYENKTLTGGTTQALYNMVAAPVEVTNKDFVAYSNDKKTKYIYKKGTVITDAISKSIPNKNRQIVLALVGKAVTDPTLGPGVGRDAMVFVDRGNFNSIINTISPGSRWNETTGEVTYAKGDKDPAIPIVELFSKIYGAEKKEMGGMLGEGIIGSSEYIALKPMERLNYIRTPEGTYKKK